MLSSSEVLDRYFLDVRCMLLEIAASLDRYDAAVTRDPGAAAASDDRLRKIYRSLELLADPNAGSNRAEQLLNLFSDIGE
jgi:hypothetical protein